MQQILIILEDEQPTSFILKSLASAIILFRIGTEKETQVQHYAQYKTEQGNDCSSPWS